MALRDWLRHESRPSANGRGYTGDYTGDGAKGLDGHVVHTPLATYVHVVHAPLVTFLSSTVVVVVFALRRAASRERRSCISLRCWALRRIRLRSSAFSFLWRGTAFRFRWRTTSVRFRGREAGLQSRLG